MEQIHLEITDETVDLVLFTDGGCTHPNQKDQSIREMISVVATANGDVVKEVSNHGGSNNLAELIAMEHALDYAIEQKVESVKLITDSQIAKAWFLRDDTHLKEKVKRKMNDYEWYQAVKGRIDELKKEVRTTIEWQPRENNLAGFYIETEYGL